MGKFKSNPPRTGYTRPSIDMGNSGEREWRDIYAKDVQPGDIVAGLGKVLSVAKPIRPFVDIEAGVPASKIHHLYGLDTVKAFVKKGS